MKTVLNMMTSRGTFLIAFCPHIVKLPNAWKELDIIKTRCKLPLLCVVEDNKVHVFLLLRLKAGKRLAQNDHIGTCVFFVECSLKQH